MITPLLRLGTVIFCGVMVGLIGHYLGENMALAVIGGWVGGLTINPYWA